MEPEIQELIRGKYEALKTEISENVIMHDFEFQAKHGYHIGHRIDKGRKSVYAQVRVCTNRETNTRRAIKSYNLLDAQEYNEDVIFAKRPGLKLSLILNEIKVLSLLDHPYICKLYEVFLEDKYIHLVLDYCKGGEIFDYLAANKTFSVKDAIPIMIQIVDAVKYLHSINLVHRALCVENIMFFDKQRTNIKIISFSSAGIGEKFTEKYGSCMYMAPEVFAENYDSRCDVWSIGVTFYTMLNGFQPFQGKNFAEILDKVNTGKVPSTGN